VAGRSSKGGRARFRYATARPPIRKQEAGRPADRRPAAHAILGRIERAADRDSAVPRLVERAQAGDDLAFAELYVVFFDRVYRYLLLALNNPDDAQEVAQDVFERLLRVLDRYEPELGEFPPWLFGVVRHPGADRLRTGSRLTSLETSAIPSPATPVAERAASLLERLDPDAGVRALIDALPRRSAASLRFASCST
jgi:RNA polymerase sigma-70 factor, ECF subfamily